MKTLKIALLVSILTLSNLAPAASPLEECVSECTQIIQAADEVITSQGAQIVALQGIVKSLESNQTELEKQLKRREQWYMRPETNATAGFITGFLLAFVLTRQ